MNHDHIVSCFSLLESVVAFAVLVFIFCDRFIKAWHQKIVHSATSLTTFSELMTYGSSSSLPVSQSVLNVKWTSRWRDVRSHFVEESANSHSSAPWSPFS